MPEFNKLEIELTESERIAKECFMLLVREGAFEACDTAIQEPELPTWYDEAKYKRGQKYFKDNRLAILNSNLVGLVCLLAEPRGLKILAGTGRSSDAESARKRYISTIIHTLSWYEVDLTPDSKSRKSLSTVRRMHFMTSKSLESKDIAAIKQSELALTAFGFMGFPLIRPHLLGITNNKEEDREAFVHVWAVLCHMVGVKEKFNICLLPMPALECLCQMFMRYILVPIIQVETPLFRHMTKAMLDGMSTYLPHLDYDSQIFICKMLCGVPGYQYCVDTKEEKFCRSILSQSEIDECNAVMLDVIGTEHIPMSDGIPVIEIVQKTDENDNENNSNIVCKHLHEAMHLSANEQLNIKYLIYDENTWKDNLNDSKFYELNSKSQGIVKLRSWMVTFYTYSVSRYLIEHLITYMLNNLRKALK